MGGCDCCFAELSRLLASLVCIRFLAKRSASGLFGQCNEPAEIEDSTILSTRLDRFAIIAGVVLFRAVGGASSIFLFLDTVFPAWLDWLAIAPDSCLRNFFAVSSSVEWMGS